MNIVRWDPFRDLVQMQSRFRTWAPAVDIFEDADGLVLHAEVPGVGSKDLDVRVEDGSLVIEGERKREVETEQRDFYRREREFGKFTRSFRLPDTLDAAKIAASYRDGVLEVRLPKREAAKSRKVKIQAA